MTIKSTTLASVSQVILALTMNLALAQFAAIGADSKWQTLLDEGSKQNKLGNYIEAEKQLAEALKDIDADNKIGEADPVKVLILAPLANASLKQSKFVEAETFYKRALSICETAYGSEDANIAAILARLASLYLTQRRYAEAEPYFTRALAIIESNPAMTGAEEEALARIYIELGTLYFKQNKSANARASFIKAQQLFEKVKGPNDNTVAEALAFRALTSRQDRNYVEAEELLKRALSISEKNLPPDSPELATQMDALASLYVNQGRYAEAAPLLQRIQTIVGKVYGLDSKKFAACLENQAVVEMSNGNYSGCEQLATQAMAIVQKIAGAQSPDLVGSMRVLATLYLLQKKNSEALVLFEKIMEAQKKSPLQSQTQITSTLKKLAFLYAEQKNYSKAEELYRALLAQDQKDHAKSAHGINQQKQSPVIASDLDNLARILEAQGKKVEAEQLREEALNIKKSLPGSAKLTAKQEKITIGNGSTKSNRAVRDKWAVVVGISNFQDSSLNLQYAAKDARDFRNFLVNEANFESDHVKLLVDSHATRDAVIGTLGNKWLAQRAKADDLVIVYISSHGSTATSEAKDTNFLAAYDTNLNNLILAGIPMQWLTAGVAKLVPSDRIVLILDVCHAGAAVVSTTTPESSTTALDSSYMGFQSNEQEKNLKYRPTPSRPADLTKAQQAYSRTAPEFDVSDLIAGKGQILIASSDAKQTSYESKNYKNGVFTYRLIEGLRQRGDQTTLTEACNYMREKVEDEVLHDRGNLQTPIVLQNWRGADLILGTKVQSKQ